MIIAFDEILPIWKKLLWPNRKSAIEPVSVMQLYGAIDMKIMKATPTFFGIKHNDEIIAVNSGFKTGPNLYRSRGIYVKSEYRNKGLANTLLNYTFEQGRKEGCRFIWSLPRKSALKTYTTAGFVQVSDFIDEGVEFGPNCYVLASL